MIIKAITCRSILTKSDLPKVDYCINPYVGCSHRCVYCYSRFMKRFTGHREEWGGFLDIKTNAPEVLEKELAKNPKRGTVLLASVTDAYQPLERKYQITRAILKVLLKYDFPVSILTKSALVLRDLDLLKQFKDCEVGLTITTLNEEAARDFEPGSSRPQERLKALEELRSDGVKTYVFIGPILPKFTDLELIFEAIQGKTDFVMAESLNLKCGNRRFLEEVLSRKYPDLLTVYRSGFSGGYWSKVERRLKGLCSKKKILLRGFFTHK